MSFLKRKICPRCKTGKDTLLIDSKSPECPYLYFHNGKKCTKFVEMDKPEKDGFMKKLFRR